MLTVFFSATALVANYLDQLSSALQFYSTDDFLTLPCLLDVLNFTVSLLTRAQSIDNITHGTSEESKPSLTLSVSALMRAKLVDLAMNESLGHYRPALRQSLLHFAALFDSTIARVR